MISHTRLRLTLLLGCGFAEVFLVNVRVGARIVTTGSDERSARSAALSTPHWRLLREGALPADGDLRASSYAGVVPGLESDASCATRAPLSRGTSCRAGLPSLSMRAMASSSSSRCISYPPFVCAREPDQSSAAAPRDGLGLADAQLAGSAAARLLLLCSGRTAMGGHRLCRGLRP